MRLVFLLLTIGLLLLLYYLNATYVINIIDSYGPFLIEKYYSEEIKKIGHPLEGDIINMSNVRLYSSIFFTLTIALFQNIFVYLYYKNKVTLMYSLYLSVLVLFLIFMAYLFYFFFQIDICQQVAVVLRKFYLSPLYFLFIWLWLKISNLN